MGETETQPEQARFTYAPGDRPGRATVEVDGQDVSRLVSRVTFVHEGGQAPQVYLDLKPGIGPAWFDSDAVVHVRETVHEDPAEAALRFLEPVDPDQLDRAVLSSMEMGGPQTYGAAALAVLRSWARGD